MGETGIIRGPDARGLRVPSSKRSLPANDRIRDPAGMATFLLHKSPATHFTADQHPLQVAADEAVLMVSVSAKAVLQG